MHKDKALALLDSIASHPTEGRALCIIRRRGKVVKVYTR